MMIPSAQLGFGLQPLLEQLSQEELSKFKSLLRTLSPRDELQHIPQTEVDEANGKHLAEILTSRCPRCWVETVTIQVFDKMNRTDLSKRAKDELRGLTQVQGEGVTHPEEVKESLEGEKPGEREEHRSVLKTIWQTWKKNHWPEVRSHEFIHGYEGLKPFRNPETPPGPFPHTVVLHGPAGIGKTTLAKKWMLEWAQDKLPETLKFAFFLSCKEMNRQGMCTFAELMSKTRLDVQEAEIPDQAQNVLFVIDGFDELKVPSGSLIHDICGDWKKQKPVPVLLASLLKRKLLPKATLLVTTRPGALRELRLLAEQPVFLEVEGLSELGRRDYFLKHFGQEDRALRAFEAMRSNPALFRMGCMPAVCWVACACLSRQMAQGRDPAPTCQTTTSLFLRFLCGQFTPTPAPAPAPAGRPSAPPPAALRKVCLLAARGLWAQTSVLGGEDLSRLGLQEADLRPFLDKNIVQEDMDCEGCYTFVHLSVQQFLAAVFYVLDSGEQKDGGSRRPDVGDLQTLLSKQERLKNPSLTPVGYFLFGLSNQQRARELETTFGCAVSSGVKQELLASLSGGTEPFSSTTAVREVLRCLYESQEEQLVKEATAHARQMALHLQSREDLVHSAFCVPHCRSLRALSLRVEKGVFLEEEGASESHTWEERSRNDPHMLSLWMDFCSVFDSNKNLISLDISQSFLSTSSVRILCEKIASVACGLQKVVLRNISPADAYRNVCAHLSRYETLTHLTLEGNDQSDMLPALCEVLRRPRCNLQYLRLVSCSATPQQWADLSSSLAANRSLTCLNLTANELLDEGARLLYLTLRNPECSLRRLSLENCHLTGAYFKDLSSALIVNLRLTHLCLAKNDLGDSGVKLLCEGLSCLDCQLRTLVLFYCNVTYDGCISLSRVLQQNSSLTHLDLGLNPIGATGLKFLCEALKKPLCNLRCLWLWGCAINPFSCADLSSALSSNQNLVTLDLGQNSLGYSGVKMLCDVLKLQSCPLQKLRLKIDKSDAQTQKLLNEIKESNPKLTIERDDQEPKNNRPSSRDFIF